VTRRGIPPVLNEETKRESFPFTVWSGLITSEHRGRMGNAIWEFLWLVDKVTREEDGRGYVLGGKAITCAQMAGELGVSERAVRTALAKLRGQGYIECNRRPGGISFVVLRSKKWARRRVPGVVSGRHVSAGGPEGNFRSDRKYSSGRYTESFRSPRSHDTYKDMYKDKYKDTPRDLRTVKTGSDLIFGEIESLPEPERNMLEAEAAQLMATTPWGGALVTRTPEGVVVKEGGPARMALRMFMKVIHSERKRNEET
jgi:hypothetical protein